MPTTTRFPYNGTVGPGRPNESNQIITIFLASATIPRGGGDAYTDVRPWKEAGIYDEIPYTDIVIEIISNTVPLTLGNGTTDRIGLYGQLELGSDNVTHERRFLLGVLGINLGNTAPQVPFVASGIASERVNFSQVVCNVGNYNRITIGGVTADIVTGGPLITVRARPIRNRVYPG